MPYPNQHAARVKDPGAFEKDSFRSKEIDTGVTIIMGHLNGESTMTTQSYRFDSAKFSADEAKKWLKDHKVEYISFEAATGEKSLVADLITGLEYKVLPMEMKADAKEEGKYEGYFAVSENKDDGNPPDILHHGACKKTIAERKEKIRPFYLHDIEKLLGPAPREIFEDDHGLFVEGKLTTKSFWGHEVWALLSDNALNEGSIGYKPVKVTRERDAKGGVVRHLWEIMLGEYSFVPFGMNPLTQIRATKAAMMNFYKSTMTASDEDWETGTLLSGIPAHLENVLMLSDELKEGRMLSTANKSTIRAAIEALVAASDALNVLMAAAEPPAEKQHSALTAIARLRAADLALAIQEIR